MDRDVSGTLDAIDGALRDYSSADAMRWVPPEERTERTEERWRALVPPTYHPGLILHPDDFAALFTAEQAAALRAIGRDVGRTHDAPPVFDFNADVFRHADRRLLDRMTRALGDVGAKLGALVEPMERLAQRFREAFPDGPPEDPRGRALWLRQHRNTGPTDHPFTHRGATWQTSRTRPSARATRTPGTSRRSRRAGRTRS